MEPKDRIAELCNRATTEEDPAALKNIMDELKAALAQYIREARRMTLLHFDYFQKHKELPSEAQSPKVDDVNSTGDIVNSNSVSPDVEKKAS